MSLGWRAPCKDGKCRWPTCPRSECSGTKVKPRAPRIAAEKGFRVVSMDQYWQAGRPGETFSVSDLALKKAKERARTEQRSIIVLMDGRAKWCVRADGAVDHHEETMPS